MRHLAIAATTIFFLFILWVIYMANIGASTVFFDLVKMVSLGDKIGHVVLFGLLTLGLNMSLDYRSLPGGNTGLLLGSCLVFAFAIIEELTQQLCPTRTFDVADLMADVAGITLFSLISRLLQAGGITASRGNVSQGRTMINCDKLRAWMSRITDDSCQRSL
jgi:VanZ family protein